MQQTLREDRSFRMLFSDLTHELSALVRHETALAKAEVSEKVSQAGSGIVYLVVGALVAFSGYLVLLAAATAGLYVAMRDVPGAEWLAPLIVGVVALLVGVVLAWRGRSNVRGRNLTPQRTLSSLQRTGGIAREQMTREQMK